MRPILSSRDIPIFWEDLRDARGGNAQSNEISLQTPRSQCTRQGKSGFNPRISNDSTSDVEVTPNEDLSPSALDQVRHMSGGQKRRLSLAVCILHAPPILILDEPTVGVDPLLSHDIWNYLRTLADEFGTTVIVTTHYIEEASGADMVCDLYDHCGASAFRNTSVPSASEAVVRQPVTFEETMVTDSA